MTRYSKEEKLTHLELWRESGLSKRQYSKDAGVHYQTFLSWVRVGDGYKVKGSTSKNQEKKPSKSFIPIEFSEEKKNTSAISTIDITYPNGVHLSCPSNIESSVLQSLLKI